MVKFFNAGEYNGVLRTPIKRTKIKNDMPSKRACMFAGLDYEKKLEKYKAGVDKEFQNGLNARFRTIEKIPALFEHFDIDKNDDERWFLLAICLANMHVPGFKVKEYGNAGAPKEWNVLLESLLFFDFQLKKLEKYKLSYSCISKMVAKKEPWNSRGNSPKTLLNRFTSIKTPESEPFYYLFIDAHLIGGRKVRETLLETAQKLSQ
jgi:hypothetical protein